VNEYGDFIGGAITDAGKPDVIGESPVPVSFGIP
jgi:hypothetical protein